MINNKLVLLRHGESLWNSENRFTGWTDVDLTKNGENEAKKAGSLLNNNIQIDLVYISYLKRAVKTFKICQKQLKKTNIKVIYDWRLNERHYGSLQGLNKSQTAQKYGEEQVLIWRRSFDTRPPPLDQDDKRHPKYDNLYKDIDHKFFPLDNPIIIRENSIVAPGSYVTKNVEPDTTVYGNPAQKLSKSLLKK